VMATGKTVTSQTKRAASANLQKLHQKLQKHAKMRNRALVGPGRMALDTVALGTEILKEPVDFMVMPTGKTATSQTKRAASANFQILHQKLHQKLQKHAKMRNRALVGPGRMALDTVALGTERILQTVDLMVMATGKTVTSQTKRAAPANFKKHAKMRH